jgi:hypothetical protein
VLMPLLSRAANHACCRECLIVLMPLLSRAANHPLTSSFLLPHHRARTNRSL